MTDNDQIDKESRHRINNHFKSLKVSLSTCDSHRAILISNSLGAENMTLEDARRLRNLAIKFSEQCICTHNTDIENR